MKIAYPVALLALLVLGSATFSPAQDRNHRGAGDNRGKHETDRGEIRELHQRLKRCHERIDRGVENGDLTRPEFHRLKRELDKVRDDEARMSADGRLTRREAERLDKELDRLERHINALKHNENKRRR
jgi:uncharacterized coiled-coil DUF342 family protein